MNATREFGDAEAVYPPLQFCAAISGGGCDWSRTEQTAEVGEIRETVGAGDEHACVDGTSDGRAGADGGEDGDVEHVADIARGERAVGLLDHDHAVVAATVGEQRGEREVARPAEHGDAQPRSARGVGGDRPSVHDRRAEGTARADDAVEAQRADDRDRRRRRPWEPEHGGSGVEVRRGERGRALRGTHHRQRARHRRRAVAASSADEGDAASGRRRFPDAAAAREHGPKMAVRPHRSRSCCWRPLQHGRARRARQRGGQAVGWRAAGGVAGARCAPPAGRPG